MSLEMLSAVWDLDLDRNQKDVLEVLAWHANADGICWPSKSRIMYKTGLSDSTVKRTLSALKQSGLVTVEAHAEGGRGKIPLYKLHPEKGVSKPPFEEWKETHLKGVNENDKGGHGDDKGDEKGVRANTKRGSGRTIKGVTAMTPEPTENQEQEPSVTEEEVANAPSSSGGSFARPPKGGQGEKQNVVSYKQFGVAQIMERVREAKEQGKRPAPVGNADLRRYGDLYEACITRDGYEVEDLEPALDYLVRCACGEGEDWLAGKKRWIPLVDALSLVENASAEGVASLTAEEANAKANTKPRATVWYLAFFDAAQEERVEDMKKQGMDHDAIVAALEADDRRVRSAAS